MSPQRKRNFSRKKRLWTKSKNKSVASALPSLFVRASQISFPEKKISSRQIPDIKSASVITATSSDAVTQSASTEKQLLFDNNDELLYRATEAFEASRNPELKEKSKLSTVLTQLLDDGNHGLPQAIVETAHLTASIDMSTWSCNDFDKSN